jgi:repressor LexA
MSRATPAEPTPAQRRILRAVAALERQHAPAFVPDIAEKLGLAGESSLTPTLQILERNGFISVLGGGARGRSRLIRLSPKGRHTLAIGGLPLLGSIPAGPLQEALAEPDAILEDHELLAYRPGDFLLRVKGDSMTGDGILDGDKVLLRPNIECTSGEIAAVLVGDSHEATLKRVFFEKENVRLRASNPRYKDIVVPAATLKIAGLFRGLIRDGKR